MKPFVDHSWHLGWCRRSLVVVNAPTHLPDCLYHVSFRRYRPLKLPLSCEVVQKGGFGHQICRGRGYPRFWTCVFKLHLLPSMWPILVEYRSASSEIRRRKKKERQKEESVVKHKSADKYVGRPNSATFSDDISIKAGESDTITRYLSTETSLF